MQATAGPFPRADAALTQPQGRPGSIVWRQLMRGACGRWKWEVLGRRGHSEAKFAQAVAAPKLMQPQPSLRVVHAALCGVSTWEEYIGERKWEVFGAERPF
jgi:hypothetical protein